jgi:Methyltransferase domain
MSDLPGPIFDDIWTVADKVPGWLTEGQARLLWEEAVSVPGPATFLEIGSHHGRSTVVLGEAARHTGSQVVAVDPFVEGRLFGGLSTKASFDRSIAAAHLEDVVELVQDYSTAARPTWSRALDYLYIDGKHDYWTLADDLRWSEHLPDGAPILVHDCFSSIGVTVGVLCHVLPSRGIRYEKRVGSLALFRKARPSWADRMRIVRELPWWLGNIGIKVLLRLRLRPVARLFGHDSPYDPY